MPQSVIDIGVADLVLSVDQIAEYLNKRFSVERALGGSDG